MLHRLMNVQSVSTDLCCGHRGTPQSHQTQQKQTAESGKASLKTNQKAFKTLKNSKCLTFLTLPTYFVRAGQDVACLRNTRLSLAGLLCRGSEAGWLVKGSRHVSVGCDSTSLADRPGHQLILTGAVETQG